MKPKMASPCITTETHAIFETKKLFTMTSKWKNSMSVKTKERREREKKVTL